MKIFNLKRVGRERSDVIASRYFLDGPRIEYRWKRDFPYKSSSAQTPVSISFPEVKQPVVAFTIELYLAPSLKEEYSYVSTPTVCLHDTL